MVLVLGVRLENRPEDFVLARIVGRPNVHEPENVRPISKSLQKPRLLLEFSEKIPVLSALKLTFEPLPVSIPPDCDDAPAISAGRQAPPIGQSGRQAPRVVVGSRYWLAGARCELGSSLRRSLTVEQLRHTATSESRAHGFG